MLTIEECALLSDHAVEFETLYAEVLDTAQALPDDVLFCEVGTREGGSALLALRAILESGVPQRILLTIDPYGGKPFCNTNGNYGGIYQDDMYQRMMSRLSQYALENRLNHVHYKMTSADFMATFESVHLWNDESILRQRFGYVYLDGEHNSETVGQEIAWFLPRLVDGGLLVIDDIENITCTQDVGIQYIMAQSTIRSNVAFYRKPLSAEAMKRKRLVMTIAIGPLYSAIAEVTHSSIRAYAERIEADFLCVDRPMIAQTTPHWEKCQIATLLQQYDRVLYLDTDLIIREDCPDLFTVVPETHLGMFNEAPFTYRSRELLIDTCRAYGATLPEWDGGYYNSGVIVASQRHATLFQKPSHEECNFYEQTWLNMRIAQHQTRMLSLSYHYNRMSCMDALVGQHRLASYLVHYAGCPQPAMLLSLIPQDLQRWKEDAPAYYYPHHIHIVVGGGLGDQVNAEPAIRYLAAQVYPGADIRVSTHWPELFGHLGLPVYHHGTFVPEPDTPYHQRLTLPDPTTLTWSVVSNLLCHTVDYCAIALLRRTLPMDDKQVRLPVDPVAVSTLWERLALVHLVPPMDLAGVVVVHAGRHWETKTFPLPWWQAVVDGLAAAGYRVCLIGKNEDEPADKRGYVPVGCPEGGIDLRDSLPLAELIALLAQAPLLVSNDSAPVHIAGAFDNHIILIPSCKHPEHVLPYRHGSVWWKAKALYTRLCLDDVSSQPTAVEGTTAEKLRSLWESYLPEATEVVATAREVLSG